MECIKTFMFVLFFASKAFSASPAIQELSYFFEKNYRPSSVYAVKEIFGTCVEILIEGKISDNTRKRYNPEDLIDLNKFGGCGEEYATKKDHQIVKNIFKELINATKEDLKKAGDKNFAVTAYEMTQNHINQCEGSNKEYALGLLNELSMVKRSFSPSKETLYEKPKTIPDLLKESGFVDKTVPNTPLAKQPGATYYGNADPTSLYGFCKNLNASGYCGKTKNYCKEKCKKTTFLLPSCPWIAPYNPAIGTATIQYAEYFLVSQKTEKLFGCKVDCFGVVVQSLPFSSQGNECPSLKLHGLMFGKDGGNINKSTNVNAWVSKYNNGNFSSYKEFNNLSVHVHDNVASPNNANLTGDLSVDYEIMNALRVVVEIADGKLAGYLIILSPDSIWSSYKSEEPQGDLKNYIFLYIKKVLNVA